MPDLDLLRVDHIGSLARPRALLETHARFDAGDVSIEETLLETAARVWG